MTIKNKLLFALASFGNITGGSLQAIFIIFWFVFGNFKNPYGILLISSLTFPLIFSIITFFSIKKIHWKQDYRDNITLLKVGIFNALNGILIVYSLQPERLPPVFQQIVLNFTIFFSIIGNKFILKDNKKYFQLKPLLALGLIFAGILVYTIPLFIKGIESDSIINLIIWTLINLIGQFFGAIYNVYQSLYINQKIHPYYMRLVNDDYTMDSQPLPKTTAILTLLTYSTIIQAMFIAFFWFVDIIPFFGLNTPSTFFENYQYIFLCNFGGPCNSDGMTSKAYIYYIVFCVGYLMTYLSCGYFNVSSAPFGQMFSVLISPTVVIFWLLFPQLDPNPTGMAFYIPLISIVVSTLGMGIWKYWEIKEDEKNEDIN